MKQEYKTSQQDIDMKTEVGLFSRPRGKGCPNRTREQVPLLA